MNEFSAFRIHAVLVCDDIRTEDSGKGIIIGVYSGDINPLKFPAQMRLSFWLVGSLTGQGEFKFQLRITFNPNDESVDATTHTVNVAGVVANPVENADFHAPIVRPQQFRFSGPGTLSVELQIGDGEFVEQLKKQVALPPAKGSSESQQPS